MSGWNSTLTRRAPMRNAPPLKRKTALRKIGKKGSEWATARAGLKKEFQARGITTCEAKLPGCWRDNGLGFAHTRKRRHVTDLRRVALLCNHCHDEFECKPEPEMERLIEAIITSRK